MSEGNGPDDATARGEAPRAGKPPGIDEAFAQLRESGIFATRQLAKRQLTWLRSLPQRVVLPCDAPDAQAQLLSAVKAALP